MKMWNIHVIMLFVFLSLGFCMKNTGSFAFHSLKDNKFNALQKKMYYPREFKKYQGPIKFEEKENLWFAYKPPKLIYEHPYAISLSKKSLGWIEIDLKNLHLSQKTNYLVDNYPELKNGKYMLTVALDNKILNSIEFEVIKEGDRKDDFIDYDMPLSVVLDSDADDLRILSRE